MSHGADAAELFSVGFRLSGCLYPGADWEESSELPDSKELKSLLLEEGSLGDNLKMSMAILFLLYNVVRV